MYFSSVEGRSFNTDRFSRRRGRALLRGNFSDRGLIYVCLILASLCGLVIVSLGVYRSYSAQVLREKVDASDPDKIEKMVPEIASLVGVIIQDVTPTRSFVIFEAGTVVIITEPCEDPQAEARRALVECAKSPAFVVNEVGSDYAVRYSGPVFSRFGGKAVKNAHSSILNQWKNYLNEAEKKAMEEKSEEPDFITKVGLVVRSFMIRDAENLKIVKILKANPAPTRGQQ